MSETQYGNLCVYVAGASPYRDGRRRAIGTTASQAWESLEAITIPACDVRRDGPAVADVAFMSLDTSKAG
jgi:hypothetical protein